MRANLGRAGRFPRTSFYSLSNPLAVHSSKPIGGGNKGRVRNVSLNRFLKGDSQNRERGIDAARHAICDSDAVETTGL
jgi:hypothetical protein